ncbi:MAG: UDP-galactopyranose mutase [Chakrabartia sp.]
MLRRANVTPVASSDPAITPEVTRIRPTLVCFSHLRWNFVFQRPQHLMSRFARDFDVFFWEEPMTTDAAPHVAVAVDPSGVRVLTPHLPDGLSDDDRVRALRTLLNQALVGQPGDLVRWFYTPMMLPISQHLNAAVTVYDCMDELSAFKYAPVDLPWLERELFQAADIVFTGGYSLYEAKAAHHANVHPFPSAVDVDHFAQARALAPAPDAPPTIGFYGVVDERFDTSLLDAVAMLRPDIRFEIVGPVVKIDPALLPQRPNLHYAGPADYAELPAILGRWHAAMMPFARNDSTRFISPTKTPEYLAGGRPVVSTGIRDVERHFGGLSGVLLADDAEGFVAACDAAILLAEDPSAWRPQVDAVLSQISWDRTYWAMRDQVQAALTRSASLAKLRAVAAPHYDFLIVGAGFAGAVMAERLAADAGQRVLIIDKRPHVAGNAYDQRNAAGQLVHRYGPHIFHTNAREIFDYLSGFTQWRPYEHRVLAQVRDTLVPIPINRTTINTLYGLGLETEEEVTAFLDSRRAPVDVIRTSEDVVLAAVGRELYELFFRGYTRKQWGLDPSELDKSVTARIPTRTNVDDRYFTDQFQAMPLNGYTAMFEHMLDHPNIDVRLGVSHADLTGLVSYDRLVWTGPIDEYFGCCFGKLPYRSLRFDHQILPQSEFQPTGTVNYPSEDVPFTRITEFGHLTGEQGAQTSLVYEYPCAEGDPYYPVPRPENQELYKRYARLADASETIFVGRLATYRYYNMDQIVGQALATYRRVRAQLDQSSPGASVSPVKAAS